MEWGMFRPCCVGSSTRSLIKQGDNQGNDDVLAITCNNYVHVRSCLKALPPDLLDWIIISLHWSSLVWKGQDLLQNGTIMARIPRLANECARIHFPCSAFHWCRRCNIAALTSGNPLCALCNLHLGVMAESISDIRPLLTLYLLSRLADLAAEKELSNLNETKSMPNMPQTQHGYTIRCQQSMWIF